MLSNLEEKFNKLNGFGGYQKLIQSGLFFEIFPELTGDYEEDLKIMGIEDDEVNRLINTWITPYGYTIDKNLTEELIVDRIYIGKSDIENFKKQLKQYIMEIRNVK